MLTIKQINLKLRAVTKSREKVVADLQVLAVSIIGHACEHGDVTLADRLLTAMGRGLDRQAMVLYLENFGPFRFDAKSGHFEHSKKKAKELTFDEAWLMDEAPQWHEFAKAKKALSSSFDLEQKVTSLLKSMQSALESGEKEVKNAGLAGYIRNAVDAYHYANLAAQMEPEQMPELPALQEAA